MAKDAVERRHQVLRRQVNEAFCSPDGSISISKTIAIFAQIVLLYKLGGEFLTVIKDWAVFAVIVSALIVPDALKKAIAMKFSGSTK